MVCAGICTFGKVYILKCFRPDNIDMRTGERCSTPKNLQIALFIAAAVAVLHCSRHAALLTH